MKLFYYLFVAGICLFLASVICDPSLKVMTLGAIMMLPYDFIIIYNKGGELWQRKKKQSYPSHR